MKTCPYCAKEIPDSAIVCRYCKNDLTRMPESQSQKEESHSCVWFLVGLVVIFIGAWAFVTFGGDHNGGPDALGASIACKEFIKDELISPSTAKFPVSSEQTILDLGDNIYQVYSYVDSENSFGATVRTDYYCKVKYSDNDYWNLVDLMTTP